MKKKLLAVLMMFVMIMASGCFSSDVENESSDIVKKATADTVKDETDIVKKKKVEEKAVVEVTPEVKNGVEEKEVEAENNSKDEVVVSEPEKAEVVENNAKTTPSEVVKDETVENNVKPTPAETVTEEKTESAKAECTYIGNKNSKKFHYPDCKSAAKMKESNKVYLEKSRDEVIAAGYTPCKNCNP